MLSLRTIILASGIFLGSLSGAGYGIFKAANKGSKSFNTQTSQILSETRKENSDSKTYKKLIKEEIKAPESQIQEQAKFENFEDEVVETYEIQESSNSSNESIEAEKVNINKQELTESFSEEIEKEENIEEAQKREILKFKEQSINEKDEKDIFLEAIWKFNSGGVGSTTKNSSCILLSNKETEKDIPDMLDLHDEEDEDGDDYACNSTDWYRWMEYLVNKDELWIRGKVEGIKKLIDANVSNWGLKNHFLSENHKNTELISEKFNKQLCEVREADSKDKNWLEIKCSFSDKPKSYFW